jgi:hypothetical protein
MTDKLSIIGLSLGSLLVAFGSAVIAWRAKEQAKKAATLEPRTKAINYIRQAHSEVTNGGYVTRETVNNIHEAKNLAALVLSREVRNELDRAYLTASQLNVPVPEKLESQHSPAIRELGKNLETLIARMNEEAALVR